MNQITSSRHSGRSKGYIAEYRPYAKTRALLDQVEQVLEEYRDYWPLTCRQIFYRMLGAHASRYIAAASSMAVNAEGVPFSTDKWPTKRRLVCRQIEWKLTVDTSLGAFD